MALKLTFKNLTITYHSYTRYKFKTMQQSCSRFNLPGHKHSGNSAYIKCIIVIDKNKKYGHIHLNKHKIVLEDPGERNFPWRKQCA